MHHFSEVFTLSIVQKTFLTMFILVVSPQVLDKPVRYLSLQWIYSEHK